MKWLKKINKGVVLTIIVLVVLVIYLVTLETSRNKEKSIIEETCKEYIEFMNKYAVIPEKSQKLYKVGITSKEEAERIKSQTKEEINKQILELEKELKTKMIDNELAVKMQTNTLREYLENNNNPFETVISNFDKEITKIKKFEFDEDQVTVTFTSKIEQETKYLDESTEETKELSKKGNFNSSDETITLQKIDGNWKLVYADLMYADPSSQGMGMTTMINL